MQRPKPLFVGGADQAHEEVVRSFVDSLPDPAPDGGPMSRYTKGKCWGQWVIDGRPCLVTLVSVGPADWRFAVFEDGPYFSV